MSILEVKGATYAVGRLNAVEQFHITRRLGPMLVVAGISVEMLRKGFQIALDDLASMAGPVLDLLSKMSDEDAEYVLATCLGVVTRSQAGGFAPVSVKGTAQLMFTDIDMIAMLRLVLEVLKTNMGNFLTELDAELTSPSSSKEADGSATRQ